MELPRCTEAHGGQAMYTPACWQSLVGLGVLNDMLRPTYPNVSCAHLPVQECYLVGWICWCKLDRQQLWMSALIAAKTGSAYAAFYLCFFTVLVDPCDQASSLHIHISTEQTCMS